MNNIRTRYTLFGTGLILGGTIFALISWQLINDMSMTALSIGTIILGVVCLGLGKSLPGISPETGQVFLEAGMDNITSIIEELGIRSKAIYLPTRMTDGVAKALIPLREEENPIVLPKKEQRFLVLLDRNQDNYGIMVVTPGSAALTAFRSSITIDRIRLEEALKAILIGNLDLASQALCFESEDQVTIELSGVMMEPRSHSAYQSMGSPVASVCAAVTAEVLDSPIRVASEERKRNHVSIKLSKASVQ